MVNRTSGGFERPLTQLIKARRSVREYTAREVPKQTVDDILECGALAPTACNTQPWLIGAVTDKRLLTELAALTDHGRFIVNAPLCFAVFCLNTEKYRLEDGCAATMNIILAAQAHGLGSCWVAGDKKSYAQDVRKLLKVPGEYELITLISTGYPAGEPNMPNKKPQGEVIFKNTVR